MEPTLKQKSYTMHLPSKHSQQQQKPAHSIVEFVRRSLNNEMFAGTISISESICSLFSHSPLEFLVFIVPLFVARSLHNVLLFAFGFSQCSLRSHSPRFQMYDLNRKTRQPEWLLVFFSFAPSLTLWYKKSWQFHFSYVHIVVELNLHGFFKSNNFPIFFPFQRRMCKQIHRSSMKSYNTDRSLLTFSSVFPRFDIDIPQ